MMHAMLLLLSAVVSGLPVAAEHVLPAGVEVVLDLPPGPDNPRNSEGDFIALKDGRILFVYTHFTGGGGDHDAAFLAVRYSSDGGRTSTTEDTVVVPNEGGMNVMSVSLLRLKSGAVALFYLRKNAEDDCMPVMRVSTDEGATWSEPRLCVESPVGYYVVNNDRVVMLESGRLLIPAARHALKGERMRAHGALVCFLSDDDGATWRASETVLEEKDVVLQEPGVVELRDGRLMMFIRASGGVQYQSFSTDGGNTWSPVEPTTLKSPLSPASIERIPKTGDLLLVWNNHEGVTRDRQKLRTPCTAAISKDDGKTWEQVRNIAADPNGWYCYTAIEFAGDGVLLGQCAGDSRKNGLSRTWVLRFDVDWLNGN